MEIFSFIQDINLLAVLCFAAGFILIVVEMFLPGFGIPGITGIILLLLGVMQTAQTLLQAFIMIAIILAILGIALSVVLHSAARGRLSKTLVLTDSIDNGIKNHEAEDLLYFLDHEGTALTALRPSGSADFDGVRLDVVTQGEFIQKDTRVKIIKIEGRRIVVSET